MQKINIKSAPASASTLAGFVESINLNLSAAAVVNLNDLNITSINATISSAAVINGLNKNVQNKNIDIAPGAVVN